MRSLTSSSVTITNNHLYNIGQSGFAKGIGVAIYGGAVGTVVRHNLIHHVSGKGIHGGHWTSTGGHGEAA
jgi:hypothetical protein